MKKRKNFFYGLSIMAVVSVILSAACSHGAGVPVDQLDLLSVKNKLVANESDKYLEFTFDQAVASAGTSGNDWNVAVSGSKVKASYKQRLTAGEEVPLTLTVAPSGKGSVRDFSGNYVAVGQTFSRAALSESLTDNPSTPPNYEIKYYDHTSGTVGLVKTSSPGGSPSVLTTKSVLGSEGNAEEVIWVALDRENEEDLHTMNIFNAIWTPNNAGGSATVEAGKSAAKYDQAISDKVHALFNVEISSTGEGDKIYIKGADLPGDNNGTYSDTNLIVIHIGLPDADNSALPKFYIPNGGLGNISNGGSGDYSHIRLRVNRGAHLVLLADNSGYENSGVGNSAPAGKFKGGCVEVMAGGKLRDGAWEGFPLGTDAVILNRRGSYLAIGAESYTKEGTTTDTFNYSGDGFQKYYSGWLIGPAGEGADAPRIVWDDGNDPYAYVEVRPGELATDAKLTAKKSFGLIYSVWFVGGAHLTVDAASESPAILLVKESDNTTTPHGIVANETSSTSFDFYGCDKSRTGESKSFITINPGNFIDGRFLSKSASTTPSITPVAGESPAYIGFKSTPSGDAVEYGSGTGISGYLLESLTDNEN